MLHNNRELYLERIHLKNFRCFIDMTLDLQSQVILIEGVNGSGKTSLLEALYYACYLRSFRTYFPRELLRFEQDNFFIKVALNHQSIAHEIQVGFSGSKRLVKVDKKTISSYKELVDYYRIVSLTEDDLLLIKGGPQIRRSFLDQAIVLCNPSFINELRTLRQIVDNRNSLLHQGSQDQDSYLIWTRQLWEISQKIIEERQQLLTFLQTEVNRLLHDYFNKNLTVLFSYRNKKEWAYQKFDQFLTKIDSLQKEELYLRRSVFGAHLDDFVISFQNQPAKLFASRGQQKLLVILIKIAQLIQLTQQKGAAVFLLDDFMTDFDQERVQNLLALLTSLNIQLIFTSPAAGSFLGEALANYTPQRLILAL
jgi:DNA replication and repair protein RecF